MSARRPLNKYLPVILFVICVLIAVILAVSNPVFWPAALAIAISGAAMALALRLQIADDSVVSYDNSEEIAELQKANVELRAEIQKSHDIIDELADVVEQIAAATADGGEAAQDQIESLRADFASIQSTPVAVAPVSNDRLDEMEIRLTALEGETRQRLDAHDATLSLTQVAPDAVAPAAATTTPATGGVRSLIARAGAGMPVAPTMSNDSEDELALYDEVETEAAPETATETPAEAETANATLAPVFEPGLGTPVAFILSGTGSDDDASGLLSHAKQIASELEEAGREVLLFLRLAPRTLESLTVRRDILEAVDTTPALQRRLTMLTAQAGLNSTVQNTLMAIADRGCKYALEDVRDWSLDLGGLAKTGLRFLTVDGLAMANSAVEQGGDPRRLAQALAVHDIALIGGSVAREADMDAVRSLEPVLVTGDGLGEARVLEPTE